MEYAVFLIYHAIDIYIWIIVSTVLLGWLVAFGVVNLGNTWARKVYELLNAATEPPLAFLRRYIPPIGGIDLTAMILMFGLYILQRVLLSLI